MKRLSNLDYIHGSNFPGQDPDIPCNVFKISTRGEGSGMDYVRRTSVGDMQESWVFLILKIPECVQYSRSHNCRNILCLLAQ